MIKQLLGEIMKNSVISLIAFLMFTGVSMAKESNLEKVENVTNKTSDAARRTYRAAKDKACETFNDKGECISQKVQNKAKNLKDSTATKAKEIKNKVD